MVLARASHCCFFSTQDVERGERDERSPARRATGAARPPGPPGLQPRGRLDDRARHRGGRSAIWSVVDAVLVRPLPFSEPERLVFVWEQKRALQRERNVAGPANLIAWRERAASFSGLAGFIRFDANLDGSGAEPERIPVGFTTGNLFTVLGTPPLLGRTLLESDSAPGARRRGGAQPRGTGAAASAPIPRPWGRRCGSTASPSSVVGVMPGSVQIPPGAALWAPFTIDERMRDRGRALDDGRGAAARRRERGAGARRDGAARRGARGGEARTWTRAGA